MKTYEKLIKKGLELTSKAQSIINSPDMLPSPYKFVYANLAGEYHQWIKRVQQFFIKEKRNKIEISFFDEIDNIPTVDYLGKYDQLDDDNFTSKFAKEILAEIRKKLEYIQKIYNLENKKREVKIILQIDEKRKEIIFKENNKFKYAFRRTRGVNKRLNYLIKIYKNPKISGNSLANTTTLQNLSGEITELNNVLKNRLNLSDDLIVNDGNSGYEIDSKFGIEFI
ncbi:MAG: hypothetical protein WCW04_03240 [Candidatus Paceibacterota bacterium]